MVERRSAMRTVQSFTPLSRGQRVAMILSRAVEPLPRVLAFRKQRHDDRAFLGDDKACGKACRKQRIGERTDAAPAFSLYVRFARRREKVPP